MNAKVLVSILAIAIVATACGGDTSAPTLAPTPPPTPPPTLPQPGVWTVTAGFGTFALTVNSASTAITQVAYNFQNWQCGGVTRSGGVTVTPSPGWPITNLQFSLQNSLTNLSMSIQGSFTSSTSASGSWSANSSGTTCSGTWTVSR